MIARVLLLLAFCLFPICSKCLNDSDYPGYSDLVVEQFPILNDSIQTASRVFSGYLDAQNGVHLYYMFFETKNSPKNAPIMLWLNGGPGCSSLLGAFTELGPLSLFSDGRVENNPHSWTNLANIIFLETPSGVGYSYNESGININNDEITVELNIAALRSFYKKFPHYKNNSFMIAGESYAGVYIPTLASAIVDLDDLHLEAILIGNGYYDPDTNEDSLLHYRYHHSLIETKDYKQIMNACCDNITDIRSCKLRRTQRGECLNIYRSLEPPIDFYGNVDMYNIYTKCQRSPDDRPMKKIEAKSKFFNSASFTQCMYDGYIREYFNLPEVRRILHIRNESAVWELCSNINYEQKFWFSQLANIQKVATTGRVKVLIYVGDFDTVCNAIGNTWFVEDLGFEELSPLKTLLTKNNDAIGYGRTFENNVHLVVVRGAGHMVPMNKPLESLEMLSQFLAEPLQ